MTRIYFDVNIDEEAEFYAERVHIMLEPYRLLRQDKETLIVRSEPLPQEAV